MSSDDRHDAVFKALGDARRRAVLDALEFTYNQPFKDQWEFVEYARRHQPQLDLLTPPKRPEPSP